MKLKEKTWIVRDNEMRTEDKFTSEAMAWRFASDLIESGGHYNIDIYRLHAVIRGVDNE